MEHTAGEVKPVVYIFHGDDSLTIRRLVDEMVHKMGDSTLAELNISRLDGRQNVDEELASAVNAMPFMVERRLVVLTNPLARVNNDAGRKRFLALLNGVPESTALVLVVPDAIDRGDWKSMPAKNSSWWLRKWLGANEKRAMYRLCALPSSHEMPEWIRKEARRQGGQFNPDAAVALAAHIGSDTQMASLEIDKLLTFVDKKRAVDASDVEDLTAQGGQADVFKMVDALAAGDARQAALMLHRLLETQDWYAMLGMIARQFRLLIQARELIDEGRGGQIASELRLYGGVAEKLTAQARRFNMSQLESLHDRLLLIDESIKTSQMTPELAFDTFIASLAR